MNRVLLHAKVFIFNGYLTLFFLCLFSESKGQNVTIPDIAFKNALLGNTSINVNLDSEIQLTEAQAYNGSINVTSLGITNLTGIEAFVNLTSFTCYGNSITSIDLTANTALTFLDAANNQISSYAFPNPSGITSLFIGTNPITGVFDLTQFPSVQHVELINSQVTGINVLPNSSLVSLTIGSTQVSSLPTTNMPNIIHLGAGLTFIQSLDLSACAQLQHLSLTNCPNLT